MEICDNEKCKKPIEQSTKVVLTDWDSPSDVFRKIYCNRKCLKEVLAKEDE